MRNLELYTKQLRTNIGIPFNELTPKVATSICWVVENLEEVFATADGFVFEFTEENDHWIADIEEKLLAHLGSVMNPEEHFDGLMRTVSGVIGADPDYDLTEEEYTQATRLATSLVLLAMRSVMLHEKGI